MLSFRSRAWLALGTAAASALLLTLWFTPFFRPPRIVNAEAEPGVELIEVNFTVESGRDTEVTVTAEPLRGVGPVAAVKTMGVGRRSVKLKVLGGVGYKVAVICGAGSRSHSVELFMPYVWQFEDNASSLAEEGVVVSAVYVPWNHG